MISETPRFLVLARYGSVPQVARFSIDDSSANDFTGNDFTGNDFTGRVSRENKETSFPERGDQIVVNTERGQELATVLEAMLSTSSDAVTGEITRLASTEDIDRATRLQQQANNQFDEWSERIANWKLQLELVDLEWTLDEKLILYVLNDRNAETTRLALLTAANGLGIVHVQPVAAEGILAIEQSGGCGSGGCGSGGSSSH